MKSRALPFRVLFAMSLVACLLALPPAGFGDPVLADVGDLLAHVDELAGQVILIKGSFLGWRAVGAGRPPITRSDWLLGGSNGAVVYCTGPMPDKLMAENPTDRGTPITVQGVVRRGTTGAPYIVVEKAQLLEIAPEPMVSVAQVLFDLAGIKGRTVGMLGVLTKGYDSKGRRLYLLADPSGAITLDRLPKLYPRGTILRIRGIVDRDEVGLPLLTHVEIVARVK